MKEGERNEEELIKLEEKVERKLRGIFLASAILCALIVVELVFLVGRGGGIPLLIRVSFFSLLLWSLIVTGYCFHTLWSISQARKTKLQELSRRDTISGAYTEDYFRRRLEEERQSALETGKAAAVAHIKVCGLEAVNETYGHTAGNVVLRDLVRIMRENVAAEAVVARLSGLEFLILMPKTSLQSAESILHSIKGEVEGYRLDLGERGSIGGLRVETGLAAYPCDGETDADITRAAKRRTLRMLNSARGGPPEAMKPGATHAHPIPPS